MFAQLDCPPPPPSPSLGRTAAPAASSPRQNREGQSLPIVSESKSIRPRGKISQERVLASPAHLLPRRRSRSSLAVLSTLSIASCVSSLNWLEKEAGPVCLLCWLRRNPSACARIPHRNLILGLVWRDRPNLHRFNMNLQLLVNIRLDVHAQVGWLFELEARERAHRFRAQLRRQPGRRFTLGGLL
jgi:hypothetical protein